MLLPRSLIRFLQDGIDIKIKLLVASTGISSTDMASLQLGGGAVEVVKKVKYLGLLVEATALSHDLIVETKRLMYIAL